MLDFADPVFIAALRCVNVKILLN